MKTKPRSPHWMEGGTGITNFYPDELETYEQAIEASGFQSVLEIQKQPMSGPCLESDYSLHYIGKRPENPDLSRFWEVYRKLQRSQTPSSAS